MRGKVEALRVLLRTSPQAAQVKVDQDYTILHLCVNYNQLAILEDLLRVFKKDPDFVASKDVHGNNILHLAVLGNRYEIVEHVLGNTEIDVNARNGSGSTALDIYYRIDSMRITEEEKGYINDRIVADGNNGISSRGEPSRWCLARHFQFRRSFTPPCSRESYNCYLLSECVSLLHVFQHGRIPSILSLTTILELVDKKKAFGIIGAGISWLAIMTMAFAYTFSIIVVSPSEEYKSVRLAILVTVILWATGISLLHVAPDVVNAILVTLILAFECRAYIRDCKETVQSPRDTASTADPNAVGEENDAGV
ncbi:hypothetical protein Vadar_029259 [Vaccinium darrowii]|uniref:Uncharacterized protein n=1 Tax=Vaccinium darrowii TaxID=229202 RepID=A0ACB7Z7N7_9ERIC|nr:hypothetical protein Vadar_029259 [Vaccinium darrowii]